MLTETHVQRLKSITTISALISFLKHDLGWPIESDSPEDVTFGYEPEELGLKEEHAPKINKIYQLRPLSPDQPFGIFFIDFENKKLPVSLMRRILNHLVVKRRRTPVAAGQAWNAGDLLFLTTYGEDFEGMREVAFAHFHSQPGDLPTLQVIDWHGGETASKYEATYKALKDNLGWPHDPLDKDQWRKQWSKPFKNRIGHEIRTASVLAESLAELSRGIRDRCTELLDSENEKGPLTRLYKAFQSALIHDLKPKEFADTFAQTITYGLLTAAISRTDMHAGKHGTAFVAEDVANLVPITNPFLKEILETFLDVGGRNKGGIDFDELGVQNVVELLRGPETDLPAIIQDFGNRKPGEDPVIHFYEHYLAAYNKKIKVDRGVFYTPHPVVSYIVGSVHKLLQDELTIEDGLASTITWGDIAELRPEIAIPTGTQPDDPFVTILDPAAGTGTFLVEVIDVIYKHLEAKWRADREATRRLLRSWNFSLAPINTFQEFWNAYVPDHLLRRLYGYELMMAPYAIAHLKLGLKLGQTGYGFGTDKRVRVYLTNALEPAVELQAKLALDWEALAHEAQAVKAVKESIRFTVLVGNPPYAKLSSNRQVDAEELVKPFKRAVRTEVNIQPISDDYVKFLGLTVATAIASPLFVFGMITNRGYLEGLIHRGVREVLLDTFQSLRIIDLHGDSNVGETSPDSRANDNVFDIKQGVAIAVGTRGVKSRSTWRTDSWGTRIEKYKQLVLLTPSDRSWELSKPEPPNFFFHKSTSLNTFTEESVPINVLMPTTNTGVKTHRDDFVIDFDQDILLERIKRFVDPTRSDQEVRLEYFGSSDEGQYAPGDNRDWSMTRARRILQQEIKPLSAFVKVIEYRPFDRRFIFYHPAAIDFAREDLMAHMEGGRNIGLITTRQVPNGVFCHAFVSRHIVEMKTGSHDRGTNLFPLFLKNDLASPQLLEDTERPNFSKAAYRAFSSVAHRMESLPECVLGYVYGMLYSGNYRSRYRDSLKTDFPRVPLPNRPELFQAISTLGSGLISLHLLEISDINCDTEFVGNAGARIERVTFSNDGVWIDSPQRQGFLRVPGEVWEFKIGGYQVCEKWLKDRGPKKGQPGRIMTTVDIEHYKRIIGAVSKTICIMREIDQVIEAHGGWPSAFAQESDRG